MTQEMAALGHVEVVTNHRLSHLAVHNGRNPAIMDKESTSRKSMQYRSSMEIIWRLAALDPDSRGYRTFDKQVTHEGNTICGLFIQFGLVGS
jgi:hypothetical protein